jgi:3-methyladenine DNA glycosylase AlkC
MRAVPRDVLTQLADGTTESVNLMEWLAADMPALARKLAAEVAIPDLSRALIAAAGAMSGVGVTERLKIAGHALAGHASPGSGPYEMLSRHKSDLVRQWVCYAANDSSLIIPLDRRLEATLRFAADGNMSVREAAWMAFRPHLARQINVALPLVALLASDADPNVRRFAVEVTRPRSVWGCHLQALKHRPGRALGLLEQVRDDPSRYVQLAVGNWLNDASKSRPDWVLELSERWSRSASAHTKFILRRGLRTISRVSAADRASDQRNVLVTSAPVSATSPPW